MGYPTLVYCSDFGFNKNFDLKKITYYILKTIKTILKNICDFLLI